ncbi:glycosyltransferase family 2 protein [Candidatus Omnitrophota bacterium]
MENSPKISIVVLIYNGMKWIDSCFKSVLSTDYSNFDVIVVDNHSSDEGVQYIKNAFPAVHVIENSKNLGTAIGYNIGIKAALNAGADFVMLLNQDITVSSNWLSELIKVARADENIGILSPIQYDYSGNHIDSGFETILKKTEYFDDCKVNKLKDCYETDCVIFASALIKKDVFKAVGFLDEMYFIYYEDLDFCRRAMFKGYKLVLVSHCRVNHNHSARDVNTLPEKIRYLIKRNEMILLLKDPNYGFFYNLKNVFVWKSWKKEFEAVGLRFKHRLKVFFFLFVYLVVIYCRYRKVIK